MNYGLYLSASGALNATYRQDVYANNLANVNTVAFKPDIPVARARDAESVEANLGFDVSGQLLDRLGGGVIAGPQMINASTGAISPTGRPLDAALPDANAFFTVRTADPTTGQTATQLTRDGRFLVSPESTLVHADGHAVLDPDGRPIQLTPNVPAQLERDGRVTQNGVAVGRVAVVAVADPSVLIRSGGNLYRAPADLTLRPDSLLETGATEASGTDPVLALMNLIESTRSATTNLQMIQYHDTLMDRSINTLARVG
jgi:flagellar basal body rod protein FlgG